ncbi:hypothetical protein BRADI_2g30552v3 [Brachypodium distachyon]|uniref:Uncharacterized protein n=1 Tax=Brachypodium distachyon TaxID=15368 RepID=A0A0Q3K7M6_BRADI|nr:hypothetical protein BRADI_2g30552v3 [Brachypodium distachyon]
MFSPCPTLCGCSISPLNLTERSYFSCILSLHHRRSTSSPSCNSALATESCPRTRSTPLPHHQGRKMIFHVDKKA